MHRGRGLGTPGGCGSATKGRLTLRARNEQTQGATTDDSSERRGAVSGDSPETPPSPPQSSNPSDVCPGYRFVRCGSATRTDRDDRFDLDTVVFGVSNVADEGLALGSRRTLMRSNLRRSRQ
jgi:hypothetical protein